MKKLILISIVFFVVLASCKKAPKEYATFSGKILNAPNDTLLVVSVSRENMLRKPIAINADGTFSDTLNLKGHNEFYIMPPQSPMIIGELYLKNGFDLHAEIKFAYNSTLSFTGVGAVENNYFLEKKKLSYLKGNLSKKNRTESEINEYKLQLLIKSSEQKVALLNTYKDKLDPSFYQEELLSIQNEPEDFKKSIKEKEDHAKAISALKGKPSPSFTFENYKGGTTSLEDFRGKYVFIDLWATWCSSCLAQLPAIKKLEKEYHDKNLVFVSISIDEKKYYEAWKQMIVDKNMGGVQLIDFGGKDKFFEPYKMIGIPRFILIDPNGNIVDAEAPRPSDPKFKEILESLPL